MERKRILGLTGCLALALASAGCPDKRPGTTTVFENLPPKSRPAAQGPARGPFQRGPFQSGGASNAAVEENVPMPLRLEGHNSVASMNKEKTRLHDGEQQKFELAYRLTYSEDKSKRDYQEAQRLYREVLGHHSDFGPAYRGIAYTFVANGFQMEEAIQWYRKAVEADPSYGLAPYGLAFMLGGMNQIEEGYRHFQTAMKLGVKDERNLKTRFFKNFNEGIRTH